MAYKGPFATTLNVEHKATTDIVHKQPLRWPVHRQKRKLLVGILTNGKDDVCMLD